MPNLLTYLQRKPIPIVGLLFVMCVLQFDLFSQTANITSGCVPLQVNFTAPGGSSTFFWDFGDGASSNLQNPSNTFASAGTFEVSFRETADGPVIGTITITVSEKPVPQLVSNGLTKGCAPLDVDLSANVSLPPGVTVDQYSWTFGEGSGATGENVNFTYTNTGVYTITIGITASTPSCNNTTSYANYIGVSNPVAGITTNPSPAIACDPPLNVSFSDGSTSNLALTYDWDFGNGNTSTSQNPGSQTYSSEGDFTATLTITDTNECAKTATVPITVGKPQASFALPNDTVCVNIPIQIENNSSAGVYTWNFGAGASPGTSSAVNPTVFFTTPGLHTIDLTVTAPGGQCSDDTSVVIFVEQIPNITITSTPKPQCDTNATYTYSFDPDGATFQSFRWIFDDGDTSFLANPTHEYHIADSIYARRAKHHDLNGVFQAVTTGGCVVQVDFIDTVFLVHSRFMPDIHEGCAPLSITFSDSTQSEYDIVNYHFDYGDGSNGDFGLGTTSSTHTFSNPGVYSVVMTATNNLGCMDISDTIQIQVGTTHALDFTADQTSVCPGESITFTNTSANQELFEGWNYSTDGELLSNCHGNPGGTFIFDDTVGVFDVTLSAYHNGCISTQTKSNFVTVNGPIARFNYLYDCASLMDLALFNESQGFTGLSWDFGDGTTSAQTNPTHTYAATGDYKVVLTATNNSGTCPASVDSTTIHIRNVQADFTSDAVYCAGDPNPFNAGNSLDVLEDCNRGYKWIFSDPTLRPIATEDPQENISFPNTGAQTLSLVVTDINGCTDTLTHSFTVFDVDPDFLIDDDFTCTPDTIQFTDQSTSGAAIASYIWDFGDGETGSGPNVSHIYDEHPLGAIENIRLTVTDIHGCQKSIVKPINFYRPVSTVSVTPGAGKGCTGDQYTFNATDYTSQGSNLSFTWILGDGTTATGQNVTHNYTLDTTTIVKMYYVENATGCNDSISIPIDVQGYPTAGFVSDIDTLEALCSPQQIGFTSTSVGTSPVTGTSWTFSNGLSSSSASPVFVFEEGDYSVQLIASTSNGCSDTVVKNFTVINPSGDFDMDKTAICKTEEITFTIKDTTDVGGFSWDFGDGSEVSDISPVTHQYNFLPPSGQTQAKLTVFGEGGVCPNTIEKTVLIREVRALFDRNDELDTLLCSGDALNITNNSLNSDEYQWIFGDGNSSDTAALNFDYFYNYSDTFLITLMVHNTQFGCRDTISKYVIMNDRPNIQAFDDTICAGDQVTLQLTGAEATHIFNWTPADVLNDPTLATPTADISQTTTFAVLATDTVTTCTSTDTATVIVIQNIPDIFYDTTVVLGDFVTLPIDNQGGLVLFTWTPDTALSCLNCPFPSHQGIDEITYTVQMTDVLGCFNGEGIFHIDIYPETFLDLPTTFTPNGDGVNDVIYLKGWGLKELMYFKIFNRWGELVFETDDINVGWDGYYKGVLQNNDTYTYKAVAKTWKGQEVEGAGHINLMR